MKLEGSVASAAPVKLARALADPEILARIAPEGCVIGTKSGETIPFKVGRKIGPVHIRLSCTMTVRKLPNAPGFDLEIHGSHLIGGKIAINLTLTPHLPSTGPRRLAWSGTMQSSGLAARLAADKAGKARLLVKDLFLRTKQVVEALPATAATPASSD